MLKQEAKRIHYKDKSADGTNFKREIMNTVTQSTKVITNVQWFKYLFMNTLDIYIYLKREFTC